MKKKKTVKKDKRKKTRVKTVTKTKYVTRYRDSEDDMGGVGKVILGAAIGSILFGGND